MEAGRTEMRIVFYSHYYAPEVNAPASRTSEHAREWVRLGHDVVVVTSAPNHPGGKIYPGYKNRFYQSATVDGVRVVRVWTYLAANEGFVRRTLNYVSYLVLAILVLPRLGRPDVVVSTSPQFFCGLAGLAAKTLWRRVPWVLEIRDLWPESIVAVGAMRKGFGVRCLEALEALAYRQATAIVSVTDSFVAHIEARGGAGKVVVIKNGADLTRFSATTDGREAKRELGLHGRFVAAYVGTHGMAHGLDTILQAAVQLRADPRIVFLLVGDGAARARIAQRRQELALDNVVMLGQQPKERMPSIWAATDASLIVLRRDDLFKTVLPSKMFEAMAMRRPIILGVEGEAKQLLDDAGAGIAITPESADELAAAITRLANDDELSERLGVAGEAHVRQHFDRVNLAKRYIDLLQATIVAAGYSQAGRS